MTRTLVMGVLNVTPDSFSDGGRHDTAEAAIRHARVLVSAGARIVDVGGESTRPGATPVALEEEQRRVLPVIEALAGEGVTVSVDTLHADTARRAAEAGARFINDVSGGTFDPDMLATAASCARSFGTRLILGHWRGVPDPAHVNSHYDDVVTEVRDWLAGQRDAAVAAGVPRDHIMVDPGLGFDKTSDQCWDLLANLPTLAALGHPVLIGASRKRMLAELLETVPEAAREPGPEGRDVATAVTSAFAARAGAWGVRVHNVPASMQALAVERVLAGTTRAQPRLIEDRVTLTGLEVFAHHGVFDFERSEGQRFIVDVELTVDLAAAARSDALDRTVHYGDLATAVSRAVSSHPVDLIETVAERVARVGLGFPAAEVARVTVHKPDAPIDAAFGDVSVTVVRRRAEVDRGGSPR